MEKEFSNECGHKSFKTFRRIYIRAYSSARIIDSQDTHTIADDSVGFSAFRMFNIYLHFYAIMYDAFYLINTSEQSSSESEGDKSHGIILFKNGSPRCFHLPHPVKTL